MDNTLRPSVQQTVDLVVSELTRQGMDSVEAKEKAMNAFRLVAQNDKYGGLSVSATQIINQISAMEGQDLNTTGGGISVTDYLPQSINPLDSANGWAEKINYERKARGLARDSHMATMLASSEIVDEDSEWADAAKAAIWHFADSATMGLLGAAGSALKKMGVTDDNFWTDDNTWRQTHTTAGEIAKWAGMVGGMFSPGAPAKVLGMGLKASAAAKFTKASGNLAKARKAGEGIDKLNDLEAAVDAARASKRLKAGNKLEQLAAKIENHEGKLTPWMLVSGDAVFNFARVKGGKAVTDAGRKWLFNVNRGAEIKGAAASVAKKVGDAFGVSLKEGTAAKAMDEVLDAMVVRRQATKGVEMGSAVMKSLVDEGQNLFQQKYMARVAKDLGIDPTDAKELASAWNKVFENSKDDVARLIMGGSGAGLGELAAKKYGGSMFAETMGRTAEVAGGMIAGMAMSGVSERFFRALGEPQLYVGKDDPSIKDAAKSALVGAGGWREGLPGDVFAGVLYGTGGGLKLIPALGNRNTTDLGRSFRKLFGGDVGLWDRAATKWNSDLDKIMATAPRKGKSWNPMKWYKSNAIDPDALSDKDLATLSSNYKLFLERFGVTKGQIGKRFDKDVGTKQFNLVGDGDIANLRAGKGAEGYETSRKKIVDAINADSTELLERWRKMESADVRKDMMRSLTTAGALFFAQTGPQGIEDLLSGDGERMGNMATQLMMAFAASSHGMWQYGGNAKAIEQGRKRAGIDDSYLPGMSERLVYQNRLREQMVNLGIREADVIMATDPYRQSQDEIRVNRNAASTLMSRLSDKLRPLADDAVVEQEMKKFIPINDYDSDAVPDGAEGVSNQEISHFLNIMHKLVVNGAEVPEFLTLNDFSISERDFWTVDNINDLDIRDKHVLAIATAKMREVINPDDPRLLNNQSLGAVLRTERQDYLHSMGAAAEEAQSAYGSVVMASSARPNEDGKIRMLQLNISDASKLNEASSERLGNLRRRADHLYAMMAAVATGDIAIDSRHERTVIDIKVDENGDIVQDAMLDHISTLEKAMNTFEAKMREASGLKDISLDDRGAVQFLYETAYESGMDVARMYAVDGRTMRGQIDGGDIIETTQMDVNRHLLLGKLLSSDPNTGKIIVPRINNDDGGLSPEQLSEVMGYLRMVGVTPSAIRGPNDSGLTGSEIKELFYGSNQAFKHGLMQSLKAVGLDFSNKAYVDQYINGIYEANFSHLDESSAMFHKTASKAGWIRYNPKTGATEMHIPHMIAESLQDYISWKDEKRTKLNTTRAFIKASLESRKVPADVVKREMDELERLFDDEGDSLLDMEDSGSFESLAFAVDNLLNDRAKKLRDLAAKSNKEVSDDVLDATIVPAVTPAQMVFLFRQAALLKKAGLIDRVVPFAGERQGDGTRAGADMIRDSAQSRRELEMVFGEVEKFTIANSDEFGEIAIGAMNHIRDLMKTPGATNIEKRRAGQLLSYISRQLSYASPQSYRNIIEALKGVDMLNFTDLKYKVDFRKKLEDLGEVFENYEEAYGIDEGTTLEVIAEYGADAAKANAKAMIEKLAPENKKENKSLIDIASDIGISDATRLNQMRTRIVAIVSEASKPDRLNREGRLTAAHVESVRNVLLDAAQTTQRVKNDDGETVEVTSARKAAVDKINDLKEHDLLGIMSAAVNSVTDKVVTYTTGEGYIRRDSDGEFLASQYAPWQVQKKAAEWSLTDKISEEFGHDVYSFSLIAGRDKATVDLRHNTEEYLRLKGKLRNGQERFAEIDTGRNLGTESQSGQHTGRYVLTLMGDLDRASMHKIPMDKIRAEAHAELLKDILKMYSEDDKNKDLSAIAEHLDSLQKYIEHLESFGDDAKKYNKWFDIDDNWKMVEQAYELMTAHSAFSHAGVKKMRSMPGDTAYKELFARMHQIAGQGARKYNSAIFNYSRELVGRLYRAGKVKGVEGYEEYTNYKDFGMYDNGDMDIMIVDDDFDNPYDQANPQGSVTKTDGYAFMSIPLTHTMAHAMGFDVSRHSYGAVKAVMVHASERGAVMAKALPGIDPRALKLMKANKVAMVMTKSAAKARFGVDFENMAKFLVDGKEESDIKKVMQAYEEGRHVVVGNTGGAGNAKIRINARDLRFQNIIHAEVNKGVQTFQTENGMSQKGIDAFGKKYIAGGAFYDMAADIGRLTSLGGDHRLLQRQFMMEKSKWEDGEQPLPEDSLMRQYLGASPYGSPNDLGMAKSFRGNIKNWYMTNSVFKGWTKNGSNSPLAPDTYDVLDSHEAVLPHHVGNRKLTSKEFEEIRMGIKLKSVDQDEAAKRIAEEFGIDKDDNMYNEGPHNVDDDSRDIIDKRKTTWVNYKLTGKGKKGFVYNAIMEARAGGNDGIENEFTTFVKGLSDRDAEIFAEEVNDHIVDALISGDSSKPFKTKVSTSKQSGSQTKHIVNAGVADGTVQKVLATIHGSGDMRGLFAGLDHMFGDANGNGYKYMKRIKGKNNGMGAVTYGLIGVAQRSPSNRINDALPLAFLGFADEIAGNQLYMGYNDAVPIAEADYDKDSFNYYWDTPDDALSDFLRLRNASGKVSDKSMEEWKAPSGSASFLNNRETIMTADNSHVKYAESQARSNQLRGQLVKAVRVAYQLVNMNVSLDYAYGGKRYRIMPNVDSVNETDPLGKMLRNGDGMMEPNAIIQAVLDSKKGLLSDKLMSKDFDAQAEIFKSFFKVVLIDKSGKEVNPDKAVEEAEFDKDHKLAAMRALGIIARPYSNILGITTDSFEGAARVPKQFDDIVDSAAEYWRIMRDPEKAANRLSRSLAQRLSAMEEAQGSHSILNAIRAGIDINDAQSGKATVLRIGRGGEVHRSMVDQMAQKVLAIGEIVSKNTLMDDGPLGSGDLKDYAKYAEQMLTRLDSENEGSETIEKLRIMRNTLEHLHNKVVKLRRDYEAGDKSAFGDYHIAKKRYDMKASEEDLLHGQDVSIEKGSREEQQARENLYVANAIRAMRIGESVRDVTSDTGALTMIQDIRRWRNKAMRQMMNQQTLLGIPESSRYNSDINQVVIETKVREFMEMYGNDIEYLLPLIMPEETGSFKDGANGELQLFRKLPMDILRAIVKVDQDAGRELLAELGRYSMASERVMRGDLVGLHEIVANVSDREIAQFQMVTATRNAESRHATGKFFNETLDNVLAKQQSLDAQGRHQDQLRKEINEILDDTEIAPYVEARKRPRGNRLEVSRSLKYILENSRVDAMNRWTFYKRGVKRFYNRSVAEREIQRYEIMEQERGRLDFQDQEFMPPGAIHQYGREKKYALNKKQRAAGENGDKVFLTDADKRAAMNAAVAKSMKLARRTALAIRSLRTGEQTPRTQLTSNSLSSQMANNAATQNMHRRSGGCN